MEVGELIGVIKGIKGAVAEPMVDSLVGAAAERDRHRPGVSDASTARPTRSPAAKSQRVKIVKHLSSSLMRCDVYLRRAERGPAPARCAPA